MSLQDLTRNCFQSGVSPQKWLNACKVFLGKPELRGPALDALGPKQTEAELSNSVLILYRSYPGDPDLTEYIKHAIQSHMLSLSVFVTTFLEAAQSRVLQGAATLDTLCRVALDAHYLSGLAPRGSVVAYEEPQSDVLTILTYAFSLFRAAHDLPLSHFHQVISSTAELAALVIKCVGDVEPLTAGQARFHLAEANDLLTGGFRLPDDFKAVLDEWTIELANVQHDGAKAIEEVQMLHKEGAVMGKGDMLGQSSQSDIVSFSLMLQRMVKLRGLDRFGAGSGPDPVAMIAAMYRWTSWSPTVFYTQLLRTVITCMANETGPFILVWKAFLVGRLPAILTSFEKEVTVEGAVVDWKNAMHAAVISLKQTQMTTHCDVHLGGHELSNNSTPSSIIRDFAREAAASGLLDISAAISIDHHIGNEPSTPLRLEMREAGDGKMNAEASASFLEDLELWSARLWREPALHRAFANALIKRFSGAVSSQSPEADQLDLISRLCEICCTQDVILDIFALHKRVSDLVAQAVLFVDDYDVETVGDPQTAYGHLGKVILFIQETVARFHLGTGPWNVGSRRVSADFLRSVSVVYPLDKLSEADKKAYDAWLHPMFRGGDEGIDDQILRATPPKTLLRIAPTLFSNAMQLHMTRELSNEALENGISYFVGPLLSWTLVGVIQAVLRELYHVTYLIPTHLHVTTFIVRREGCPRAVLRLCGPELLAMAATIGKGPPDARHNPYELFGMANVRKKVMDATKRQLPGAFLPSFYGKTIPTQIPLQPKQALHYAISQAVASKAPGLDIERCLVATSPIPFLQALWAALAAAHTLDEIESSRRIAVFVLTTPPCAGTPPLLPTFLHALVPPLIVHLDRLPTAENVMLVELLSIILSSALTAALHVEWAFQTVSKGAAPVVLGQSSMTMARSLAAELRRRKSSPSSAAVLQRLCASQAFTTNFPVMKDIP
ncbi:mediator complex subunit Med5-domain-containing protein [Schizophyllum amplum]|uniref:Mediator of RNA polymerase II transcription subunit 5 n=1 Tax=Schizophyllum amplum TaxID=97359 RepID=A0A550CN29_9AGAR|nr:mediator complex subunit Med5-domain-containing protein [Auriculariopsis ampla]